MEKSGSKIDRKSNFFIIAMFSAVVIISMFSCFFGTQAVLIMAYYHISTIEYGTLTMLIYLAGLAAGIVLIFIGDSINKIFVFSITFASLMLGLFLFSLAIPFGLMLALGFASGFVFTLTDILTAATVLEAFSQHKTTLYPRLCSFFDLGTIIGPFFATFLVTPAVSKTFTTPFLLLSCIGAFVFVLLTISGKSIMHQTPYANKNKKLAFKLDGFYVFKKMNSWLVLIAGVMIFMVYTGIVTWMPTFANLEVGISFQFSGLLVTLCFAASISARMLGTGIYKILSLKASTQLFGLIAASCILIIGLWKNPTAVVVLVILGGGCMGITLSSIVLFLCDLFPEHPSTVAVISLLMFNIGGTITPVFMSQIAEKSSFGIAFVVIAIFSIAGVLILNAVKIPCNNQPTIIKKQ